MYPAARLLISVSAVAVVAMTLGTATAHAQAANLQAVGKGGPGRPGGGTPTVVPTFNPGQVMGTTQTQQDDDKPKSNLGGHARTQKIGDKTVVDPEGDSLVFIEVRKPKDPNGGDANPNPDRDPNRDPNREPDPNDPVDVDRVIREVVNLGEIDMPRSIRQDEDGNVILARDPCPNDNPGAGAAAAAASQKAAASGSCGSGINGSCNVGSNAISEMGPDGKPINQIASLTGGAGHSAPMSKRTNKPLDDHVQDCSEDPTGLACTGTGAGISAETATAAPPPPPPPTCTGVPLPGNAPAPVVEAIGSVDVALDCDSSHATMGCRPKAEKLRVEKTD